MSTTTLITNQPLRQAVHAALIAQLELWAALAQIERLSNLPNGDTLQDRLMEFAIGIETPDQITQMLDRAIQWICVGAEDAPCGS